MVLLHDMFGWKLPNSRLLADRFASSLGVTVYLPDFFSGEQLHPADWDHLVAERKGFFSKVAQGFQFMVALPKLLSFMKRHGAPVVRPHMDRFLAHLRAVEGAQRIGAIGYCWGGRYAVLLTHLQPAPPPASSAAAPESAAAAGGAGAPAKEAPAAAVLAQRPAVDVAVSCHPSLLEVPAELAPTAAPILFVCADKDDLFTPAAVASAKHVAEERSKAAAAGSAPASSGGAAATAGAATTAAAGSAGMPISFAHYPGTRHGFAVRGDDSDPAIAAARQKAFDDAVAFLRPVLAAHAASPSPTAPAVLTAAQNDEAAGTITSGASMAQAAATTSIAAPPAGSAVSDSPVSA